MANFLTNLFKGKQPVIPKEPPKGEVAGDSSTTAYMDAFMGVNLNNPDEILKYNHENKAIEIYREMTDKDPKIDSCLQTRIMGVVGKGFHVEPGSEEDKDAEIAQMIQFDIFEQIDNFKQDLEDSMMSLQDGYAVLEVIWGYDEKSNLYRPYAIKSRDVNYFSFEPDTHRLLFKPANEFDYKPVPDYKFLVFTYQPKYENPFGRSVLRSVYWYYWIKKLGIKFWAYAIEAYGVPHKKLTYEAQQGKEQQQVTEYVELLENSRKLNSDIVIPKGIEIDLLEAVHQAGGSQEKFCDYIDRMIAQKILGQTLTSDIGKFGSRAAVQGHEEIRQDIIEGDWEKLLQPGWNILIRWIHDLNWGPPKYNYPTLKGEYEPEKDRKDNASIFNSALNSIKIPLRIEQVYNDLGLEQPTEDDTPETILQPPQPEPMPDDKNKESRKFAEETQLNKMAIYPPANRKVYKIASIATIQEKFRKKLDKLFTDLSDKLPDIFSKARTERDLFRSLLDDWLRNNYESELRGYITIANTEVLKTAAYDMAAKLEMTLNRSVFDAMTKQFLQEHFYEFGTVERITMMKNTMLDDLLRSMERLDMPDYSINNLVDDMIDHWKGMIAPAKIKQITLTETRSAANWAAIQIGKQSGLDLEAYFWVDPASCELCQEWAMRNPYTLKEAQEMGLPHPSCNDQWVMTLKSEKA